MKRFSILLLSTMFGLVIHAQTPDGINYQAVARDGSGTIMANQSINVTFLIRSTTATGVVQFEEDHIGTTTNQYGLFTLQIGSGTPVIGTLAGLALDSDKFFIEVEVNGASMGTTQLLAVPYALMARTAENVDDADSDPSNEIQTLSKSGNTVTLSNNGGSFTDDNTTYSAGSGISISGTTISNTGDTNPSDDINTGDAAGGDLNGTYPNPGVNAIQGQMVATTTPANGEVLKWNGTQWEAASDNVGSSPWTEVSGEVHYPGNTGIGITNPSTRLHVVSPTGAIAQFDGSSSASYIQIAENGTGRAYMGSFSGAANDADFGTVVGSTGSTHLTIAGLPRLTVHSSGSVGIGQTNPLAHMHVHSGAGLTELLITPVATTSGDSSRIFLSEDDAGDFGMYMLYDGFDNELEFWGKSSAADYGPHMTIERNSGLVTLTAPLQLEVTTTTPDPKQVYGNSMPLAYAAITFSGSFLHEYGFQSVAKTGTGSYTIVLDNDFSGAPVVIATSLNNSATDEIVTYDYSGTDTIFISIADGAGTAKDSAFSVVVFGMPN